MGKLFVTLCVYTVYTHTFKGDSVLLEALPTGIAELCRHAVTCFYFKKIKKVSTKKVLVIMVSWAYLYTL